MLACHFLRAYDASIVVGLFVIRSMVGVVVVLAGQASAAEMAFYIRNDVGRAVVVELHSTTRDQVWPGYDEVYLIDKGEKKSVPVTCEAGELICYGAWLNGDAGTHWGVGPENDQHCTDCCYVCKEKTTATIVLRQ